MKNFIISEHLKYKHTFSKKLLLIAPIATIILAWLMGAIYFQYTSVYWWYAFVLCGVVALLAGYSVQGEKRAANYNSVYSMPISLPAFWTAKALVISLFVITASLITGLLTNASQLFAPRYTVFSPLILLIGFAAIGISVIWQVPLCMMLAQKAGLFVPVLLNSLLGLFSTMIAGKPFWWISPYVWTAKLVEPLFGIKATGEPANASSFDGAMIPAMLCASLTLFGILLLISARSFARQEVK